MQKIIFLIASCFLSFNVYADCWKLKGTDTDLPSRICIENAKATLTHTDFFVEFVMNGQNLTSTASYKVAEGAKFVLAEAKQINGGCESSLEWTIEGFFDLSGFGVLPVQIKSLKGTKSILLDTCHSDPIINSFEYIQE